MKYTESRKGGRNGMNMQEYLRYTNDMEFLKEVMSQTMEGRAEHMGPLRKKMNIDYLIILPHL